MNALPYLYIPADGPETPLVVNVPHAGTRVPDEDAALIVSDKPTLLRDADLWVDRLYRNAATLGADLLVATVSRYVLDLNRAPDNVDREVCPGLDHPAPDNPKGLIWRLSTDATPVLGRPLTPAELQSRIDRVHTPYHQKLAALLQQKRERFGYAILLDGHSMPSVGRQTHTDTGRPRAHVVPGDNKGQACSPALTTHVCDHFKAAGLTVALNTPYSGGYITRHYGQPQDGIHAIQVELNRALYLHEEVPTWNAGPALELQAILDRLVLALSTFKP